MIALLFLLWLPNSSAAAIAGSFRGTGTSLMHKSGTRRDCAEIFLRLRRSENKVEVMEGGYRCGDLQASFDPFTLEIRQGKIFSGGKEVGTVTENRLELSYEEPGEDFTFHWLIESSGEELSYLEEWSESHKPALTVRGRLKSLR